MKPIRILQVFAGLDCGGAENRMMDVYRNINRIKCNFDFLSLSTAENQFFETEITNLGGTVIKIPSPKECGIINHIKYLRKVMRLGNYTVVHAHTSYHCGIVMLCAYLEKIPIRISHSRTTGSIQKNNKILFIIGRILINRFATYKLAVSDIAGKFLYGKGKYLIIPNTIDITKYQNVSNEDIIKLRSDFKISDNSFIIGQIGRFESMKNHIWTVEWFNNFLKEKPDSVLFFVGDGSLKQETEKKCRDFGIENKIIFTGIRKDVPKLLHLFNVLLLPSLFEGLPGVTLESQACGTPCVISDTITKETDMGLNLIKRLSLNTDFNEWSKEIINISKQKKLSNEDIIAGFNNKEFSINNTVSKYCKIYKGL